MKDISLDEFKQAVEKARLSFSLKMGLGKNDVTKIVEAMGKRFEPRALKTYQNAFYRILAEAREQLKHQGKVEKSSQSWEKKTRSRS